MSALPILLAISLAAAAPAPAPVQDAQTRFTAGQAAFAKGEFDKALKLLDDAAGQPATDPLLAQIHLLRGQCFAALPDAPRAEEAFLKALEFDPDAKLDPARVRPSVVAMLDKQRGAARGELSITTDQPAEVVLDDQTLGSAPFAGPVAIGHHVVYSRTSDGRTTAKQEVRVRAKHKSELALSFAAALLPPPPPMAEQSKRFGGLDLWGDLRVSLQPAPAFGMTEEIGLGVGLPNVAGSLHLGLGGKSFAFAVRATGMLPKMVSLVGVHGSIDVPFLVLNGSLVAGLGGAVGVDVTPASWIEPYLELQYRHLFGLPTPPAGSKYAGDPVLLGLGVRLRLP